MPIKPGDRLPEGRLTEATEFDDSTGCPMTPRDLQVQALA